MHHLTTRCTTSFFSFCNFELYSKHFSSKIKDFEECKRVLVQRGILMKNQSEHSLLHVKISPTSPHQFSFRNRKALSRKCSLVSGQNHETLSSIHQRWRCEHLSLSVLKTWLAFNITHMLIKIGTQNFLWSQCYHQTLITETFFTETLIKNVYTVTYFGHKKFDRVNKASRSNKLCFRAMWIVL